MSSWAERADAAEQAVCARHLSGPPGGRLGVAAWPPSLGERWFARWNYWWQAQLLDCLVDAQGRAPRPYRAREIAWLVRGIRLRNGGRWLDDYYEDVAWLGLALERARAHAGMERASALAAIMARLREGWTDHGGGGIWWRRGDDVKSVPANGAAAILLARLSERGQRADMQRARAAAEWVERALVDAHTGVVFDGLHVDADGSVREVDRVVYTYGHGVYLGACVELAELDGAPRWARRAERTIGVVAERMVTATGFGPVIRGQGEGDGGLFAGVLARYLTRAALVLADAASVRRAAEVVYASADAAWANSTEDVGGPVFGEEWSKPGEPARDLSVQLSGWTVLEAAALLTAAEVPDPR